MESKDGRSHVRHTKKAEGSKEHKSCQNERERAAESVRVSQQNATHLTLYDVQTRNKVHIYKQLAAMLQPSVALRTNNDNKGITTKRRPMPSARVQFAVGRFIHRITSLLAAV